MPTQGKARVVNDITELVPTMKARLLRVPSPLTLGGQEMDQFLLNLDWDQSTDFACAVCGDEEMFQEPLPWRGVIHQGRFRPICAHCYRDESGIGPLLPLVS